MAAKPPTTYHGHRLADLDASLTHHFQQRMDAEARRDLAEWCLFLDPVVASWGAAVLQSSLLDRLETLLVENTVCFAQPYRAAFVLDELETFRPAKKNRKSTRIPVVCHPELTKTIRLADALRVMQSVERSRLPVDVHSHFSRAEVTALWTEESVSGVTRATAVFQCMESACNKDCAHLLNLMSRFIEQVRGRDFACFGIVFRILELVPQQAAYPVGQHCGKHKTCDYLLWSVIMQLTHTYSHVLVTSMLRAYENRKPGQRDRHLFLVQAVLCVLLMPTRNQPRFTIWTSSTPRPTESIDALVDFHIVTNSPAAILGQLHPLHNGWTAEKHVSQWMVEINAVRSSVKSTLAVAPVGFAAVANEHPTFFSARYRETSIQTYKPVAAPKVATRKRKSTDEDVPASENPQKVSKFTPSPPPVAFVEDRVVRAHQLMSFGRAYTKSFGNAYIFVVAVSNREGTRHATRLLMRHIPGDLDPVEVDEIKLLLGMPSHRSVVWTDAATGDLWRACRDFGTGAPYAEVVHTATRQMVVDHAQSGSLSLGTQSVWEDQLENSVFWKNLLRAILWRAVLGCDRTTMSAFEWVPATSQIVTRHEDRFEYGVQRDATTIIGMLFEEPPTDQFVYHLTRHIARYTRDGALRNLLAAWRNELDGHDSHTAKRIVSRIDRFIVHLKL